MVRPFLALSLLAACAGPATTGARLPPTSLPPSVQHTEGRLTGRGGVTLYEQAWAPKSGQPRAVLVVMHGLKDHSSRYAALAVRLVDRGFAVRAFDLRGHGKSEGERVWVDAFDDYLDDLGTFVAQVRAEAPGVPVFLFGHSMGGAIVTLYALTRSPPIAGLILSAPAIHVDKAGIVIGSTKLLGSLAPHAGVLKIPAEDFSRDPAVVSDQLADPLVFQGGGAARTAAELFRAMDRIDERAQDLDAALLALHGTADRITDPSGTRALVERAKSTDKTLKLYPGLYHDLLHEPERDTVAADIVQWLDAHSPRSNGP